jgi:hypothetical protein
MTRDTIDSGTAGAVTGDDYMDNVAAHVARFWDASVLPLTSVGGTASAVTATLTPPLLAGLVNGMKVTITWGAANPGAMTLALNGGSPVAVLDASGGALVGGEVSTGLRSILEVVGTAWRLLTGASAGGGPGPYYLAMTASGTWTVPTGYDADTPVRLQAWGGGGGGGSNASGGAGGGGTFVERKLRYADLAASYAVTIGAGGAVNTAGGTTTIGSLLTAHGGGRGENAGSGGGGAGGSPFASGGDGGFSGAGTGGIPVGRDAGAGGIGGGSGTTDDGVAAVMWGGAGGAGSGGTGGAALHGGAGGGSGGAGGVSLFGGNGGAATVAGSAPAGGGGRNAAGARGEARFWIG